MKRSDRNKVFDQMDKLNGRKKKPKKRSITAITNELWELCKQEIRAKYGNTCFTCSKTGLKGSDWHTGHFIPSSVGGAWLRYDLRNLRPQCYNCNINAGGNGAIYYQRMVATVGQVAVDQLMSERGYLCDSRTRYEQQLSQLKDALKTSLNGSGRTKTNVS